MSESVGRGRRARALFEEVRQQPPAAQAAALAAACAGDAALETEVAGLLAAAANAGSFLEHGAAAALAAQAGLSGRRVGPYEIQEVIGAGGMGEVYRARDTALSRDVALKVLPPALAADPERVARFRREAQILAALNHPHIAAIYGIEEADGAPVLVLELVEGATLADRMAGGPVPLDEALPIARGMTEALEAAHAQGIVHRDLKPANVKLRPDGTVKVLDFGLAKALEPVAAGGDASHGATISSPALTRLGVILGTAAYMSPEQAKGRAVDTRTDVWAFGCMLFEMLTGRRAFAGEDVSDTLAALLTRTPDWGLLPPDTPVSIRRLLRRCLEKDRARRLADVADARLELDEKDTAEEEPPPAASNRWRRWVPWASAALVALALAATRMADRPPSDNTVYRASIVLPGRLGATRSAAGAKVALSPDGRQVALVVADDRGHTRIWIRPLDGLAAQPLADTVDAESPFWSPDGRWLGFIQSRRLKKIDLSGVQAVTLAEDALGGGAWSRDDVILFTQVRGSLAQVPASGGTPVPLATIPENDGQVFNGAPHFLPDGRTFIYVCYGLGSVHLTPYVASLDPGTAPVRLPLETGLVQYAKGFLWFRRDSTLMAQPFDPGARAVTGEAIPVAEQLRIDNAWVRTGIFSVSATGTLVFQPDTSPGNELTWYDRTGRVLGTLGAPADYADVQMAPDGGRVLVSVAPSGTPTRDAWIFDVARGLRTRFTFDDDRPIRGPIWSRDGRRVVYASERQGHIVLLQRPASGAEAPSVLFDDPFDKEPVTLSPDGRFLLYMRRATIGAPLPWVLPLDANATPFELPQPRARFPQFSPDGRWIAYDSMQSGRVEVYVAPFPGPGSSTQVSTAGGFNPRWRADGKEVLYLNNAENKLMAAAVAPGKDRVLVGEVKPLFELPWIGPRFTFDVTPDGQRILAVTRASPTASTPLTLIVNWPALLKK